MESEEQVDRDARQLRREMRMRGHVVRFHLSTFRRVWCAEVLKGADIWIRLRACLGGRMQLIPVSLHSNAGPCHVWDRMSLTTGPQ